MGAVDSKMQASKYPESYENHKRFAFEETFKGRNPTATFFLGLPDGDYPRDNRRNAVGDIFSGLEAEEVIKMFKDLRNMDVGNDSSGQSLDVDTLLKDQWMYTGYTTCIEDDCDDEECHRCYQNKRRPALADIFKGLETAISEQLNHSFHQIIERRNSLGQRFSCPNGQVTCYQDACQLLFNNQRSAITDIHTSELLGENSCKRRNSLPHKLNQSDSWAERYSYGNDIVNFMKDIGNSSEHRNNIQSGNAFFFQDIHSDIREGFSTPTKRRRSYLPTMLERTDSWIDRYTSLTDGTETVHVNKRRSGKANVMDSVLSLAGPRGEISSPVYRALLKKPFNRVDSWTDRYSSNHDHDFKLNKRRSAKSDIFQVLDVQIKTPHPLSRAASEARILAVQHDPGIVRSYTKQNYDPQKLIHRSLSVEQGLTALRGVFGTKA